jgi:hypothetical protein
MNLTVCSHLAPVKACQQLEDPTSGQRRGGLIWFGTGLRYTCHQVKNMYAGPRWQSLIGRPLDVLVGALVLQALESAASEISLQVAADVEAERHQVHQQWPYRLERAQNAVERASRQYKAVAPENRLVQPIPSPTCGHLKGLLS